MYTYPIQTEVSSQIDGYNISKIPGGVLITSLYGGSGACQHFVAEPQILSHSLEEAQILSLKIV